MRDAVTDEFTTLMPVLRRLPRHIDRISAALETGRLSVNMRVFADDRDRQYVTGLVHKVLIAFLAAVSAVVAAMMLGLHGGPNVTCGISLYQFFGYSLLVTGATLAVRVLVVAVGVTTS